MLQREHLGGFESKVPKVGQHYWDTSQGLINPDWVPRGRVSDVARPETPYDLRKHCWWCVYRKGAQIQSMRAADKSAFLSYHAENASISVLPGRHLFHLGSHVPFQEQWWQYVFLFLNPFCRWTWQNWMHLTKVCIVDKAKMSGNSSYLITLFLSSVSWALHFITEIGQIIEWYYVRQ